MSSYTIVVCDTKLKTHPFNLNERTNEVQELNIATQYLRNVSTLFFGTFKDNKFTPNNICVSYMKVYVEYLDKNYVDILKPNLGDEFSVHMVSNCNLGYNSKRYKIHHVTFYGIDKTKCNYLENLHDATHLMIAINVRINNLSIPLSCQHMYDKFNNMGFNLRFPSENDNFILQKMKLLSCSEIILMLIDVNLSKNEILRSIPIVNGVDYVIETMFPGTKPIILNKLCMNLSDIKQNNTDEPDTKKKK